MYWFKNGSTYALGCALALSACSESEPDLDRLRKDFNNPSGSTSNQEAVIAVSTKQQGAGPLEDLTTAVPGLGLTASDRTTGLTQLNPRFMWESRARRLHEFLTLGRQRAALTTAQVSGTCDAAAEQALQELFANANPGDNSFSGSTSFALNLASCTDDLTGDVAISVEVEATQNSFEMTVTEELNNVCEVATAEQACVSGSLVMEVTGSSLSTAAELSFLVGWELSGTWQDGGRTLFASLKGGVRSKLTGSNNSGLFSVEFLFYVSDPSGEEYSYVLEVVAEDTAGAGSVSWKLRGSDGEIECSIQSTGAGMCTGPGGQLSWTAEQADSLNPAWLG